MNLFEFRDSSIVGSRAPHFVAIIENSNFGEKKIDDIKGLFQDIFINVVNRGLNEGEFTLLLDFFKNGNISVKEKIKLLQYVVPANVVPPGTMLTFMVWFTYKYRDYLANRLSVNILQWIIGLLDNDLLDPKVIDVFYQDFIYMLKFREMAKYVCKILCKITKPYDVTESHILFVCNQLENQPENEKYLLAVVNVFRRFKPRSKLATYGRVDVTKVLKTVPQNMDSIIQLVKKKQEMTQVAEVMGVVMSKVKPDFTKKDLATAGSSQVPFPAFSEKAGDVDSYPKSIEEAFTKQVRTLPMPQNILSLLLDDTGFFMIMYSSVDVQMRFSNRLLQTLQNGLINHNYDEVSSEDIQFLLGQTYRLQVFMQQAVPCVSMFLAGYLLQWDGVDYRSQILNLIKWTRFNSYAELSSNILRPLHMLFVSYDLVMKRQILQTLTKLIRNMVVGDVGRVGRRLPYQFLTCEPQWAHDPREMLEPLIKFTQNLITLALNLEPRNSNLLLECVNFYEEMNVVESHAAKHYGLAMWTVVSEGVVYRSLMGIEPNALNQVCRLLLKYFNEFLPEIRSTHPEFYSNCRDKICLVTKYTKEFMNILWEGKAMSGKEDGILMKRLSEKDLEKVRDNVDLDRCFDITNHICFQPFVYKLKEEHGSEFLQKNQNAYLAMLENFTPDVAAFIKTFNVSD